ncbi:UNVERIFIED_CONTAM: hypothetical protein FKN15_046853 [Acipenser sinensis]
MITNTHLELCLLDYCTGLEPVNPFYLWNGQFPIHPVSLFVSFFFFLQNVSSI